MTNFSRALVFVFGGMLGGCCGDQDAILQVHVVDGETGALLASPIVLVDGEPLYCDTDIHVFDSPVPTDDGGLPINDDGGTTQPSLDMAGVDMSASPPQQQACATYVSSLSPGFHTVQVSAYGYFTSSEEVNMGDGGNSFSCPSATAVETTIALYQKN